MSLIGEHELGATRFLVVNGGGGGRGLEASLLDAHEHEGDKLSTAGSLAMLCS
jgi:hypothetical protein